MGVELGAAGGSDDNTNKPHELPPNVELTANSALQCHGCLRYYQNAVKLNEHIKKYCTKEKKYKCLYCEYKSRRRDHILRHATRKHPREFEMLDSNGTGVHSLIVDMKTKIKKEEAKEAHNNNNIDPDNENDSYDEFDDDFNEDEDNDKSFVTINF